MKTGIYALLLLLTLSACASHRGVQTVAVERKSQDAVYRADNQTDSVFVFRDRFIDRSRDTLLIKEMEVKHHYHALHDTIVILRRDSIPYEVRVTEVRNVPRKRTWLDYLSYASIFFVIIWLIKR